VRDCANHLGVPAAAACRRCDTPICDACKETLDGQPYCTSCVKTLTRRLAGAPATDPAPPALIEPPRAALSPKAIAGAIAGGVAGALLWYGIVAVTDTKIGIVAIGVGWLVARGGLLGNGGRGGASLALACVGIAIASMLLGEYLIVNHVVHRVLAEKQPGMALPAFISAGTFASVYGEGIGPMDFVFYAIGAWEAWRRPARAK